MHRDTVMWDLKSLTSQMFRKIISGCVWMRGIHLTKEYILPLTVYSEYIVFCEIATSIWNAERTKVNCRRFWSVIWFHGLKRKRNWLNGQKLAPLSGSCLPIPSEKCDFFLLPKNGSILNSRNESINIIFFKYSCRYYKRKYIHLLSPSDTPIPYTLGLQGDFKL